MESQTQLKYDFMRNAISYIITYYDEPGISGVEGQDDKKLACVSYKN